MRLTPSGTTFLILGVGLIACAYFFGFPGMLPAGLLLVGLVAASVCIGLFIRTRLSAGIHVRTRHVSHTPVTRVGNELDVRLTLHNRSAFPLGAFQVTFTPQRAFGVEQIARMSGLAGHGRVGIDAGFAPQRRGLSGVEKVTIKVMGPFSLCSVRSRLSGAVRIAVAPQTLALRAHRRPGAPSSLHDDQRLVRGTSTRDFQTREYVPGDDLRHVHWPTTARVGDLVVREEAQEETPGALVVLDLSGSARPMSEDLITGAAAGARMLLHQGLDVRFVFGETHRWLRGTHGTDTLDYLVSQTDETPAAVRTEDLRGIAECFIAATDPHREDALVNTLPRLLAVRRWAADELDPDPSPFLHWISSAPGSWLTAERSRR